MTWVYENNFAPWWVCELSKILSPHFRVVLSQQRVPINDRRRLESHANFSLLEKVSVYRPAFFQQLYKTYSAHDHKPTNLICRNDDLDHNGTNNVAWPVAKLIKASMNGLVSILKYQKYLLPCFARVITYNIIFSHSFRKETCTQLIYIRSYLMYN